MQKFKLISLNTPGNVHEAALYLNEMGVADYVLQIDYCVSGYHSVALLKVPIDVAQIVAAKLSTHEVK